MATQQIKTKISLNYLSQSPEWAAEIPYEMWTMTVPEGLPRTNVQFQLQDDCEVTDIRILPERLKPALDVHGFEVIHCPFPGLDQLSSIENIGQNPDKQQAMKSYLSFMTEKLKDQYNGTKAICFDWRVRKATNRGYDKTPRVTFNENPNTNEIREQAITAAFNIHGDGSPDNFKKQLLYLLTPEEQVEVAEGRLRLRLINMWRPVVPVETGPLALCDVRTVAEEDWEPVEKIFDDWVEESMYLKHNPSHQWYWISNQAPDEVTTFTIWDSEKPDDKNAAVAHCSFKLPDHLRGSVIRQSIEMRLMLWTRPTKS
ncbi:hypothetical protein ACQKWADRAFT_304297 [Trichoderma austrokoningii]